MSTKTEKLQREKRERKKAEVKRKAEIEEAYQRGKKDVLEKTEPKPKTQREELAMQLGELAFERNKLVKHTAVRRLNQTAVECNRIATEMESLEGDK